jgi:hypothetical protein
MGDETGKNPPKVPVPVWLGVMTVVFTAVVVAWAGASSNTAVKKPVSSKVGSLATADDSAPAEGAPQPAAPKTTVDVAHVKAYLSAGTEYYVKLFQQGQQALGTTQYADAYAGVAALDDPSSAASVWSRFNSTFSSTDHSGAATQAYNQASDLYTAANVDTSSAVNDWNDDINQAESDIGPWVRDATSWQISSISTAQLNSDAQTFQQDIARAKADIAKL